MRFVGQVLRDAIALLGAAPADLMLAVAGLYVLGALLAVTGAALLLGLVFDFAASTLLAAGLVARPGPDGLQAAAVRLGRRLVAALGQLLALIGLFVGLAFVIALVLTVVGLVVAPDLVQRLGGATTDPALATDPRLAGLAVVVLLGLLVLAGRLLPSAGLVLDRPVGAVESLRLSWSSTRGRTLACATLMVIATAPSWLLALLLPVGAATFLSILAVAFTVAVGVAAYHLLFADEVSGRPAPR
jgi:hypothetical protein